MRRWAVALVVGALSALVPVALPVATSARAASGDPVAMEQQFVSRINGLRSSKGLGGLTVDAELTGIARRWAANMARAGGISHNPSLASQVTENWVKLGENVGMGPDVDSLFTAFVQSPHHYANLVDPAFTRVGVGVVLTADGTIYTAHEFMSLAGASQVTSAPAQPRPAPAPVRRPAPPAAAPARAVRPAVAAAPPPAPVSPPQPGPVAAPPAQPIEVLPTPHAVQSLEVLRSFDPDAALVPG